MSDDHRSIADTRCTHDASGDTCARCRHPSRDASTDTAQACDPRTSPRSILTRREMIGRGLRAGLGAAAGLVVLPDALAASSVLARPSTAAAVGVGSADLEVALRAARWIRTSRIQTPNGMTWPANPLVPTSVGTDLYNGMPGVVLFHLELYQATGDRSALDEARRGVDELITRLPAADESDDCGLYTGLAGLAFMLEETHRASGEGRYRDAARRTVGMIHAHAQRAGAGVAWTGESATNDIISGSAGIGLVLLWAARRMNDAASGALAMAVGRRLVEVGQPAEGGVKWAVAPGVKSLYPNFSHGTAGVSYFLATLYQTTGERAFLDAVLAGATYLQAVANTDRNGLKVFHHEPGGENLFYLSWCHGPAGTSRLFSRLAAATHDERWLDEVRRAARAVVHSDVPEQRTPGFWNNISQCCGNAGVGEFFITL